MRRALAAGVLVGAFAVAGPPPAGAQTFGTVACPEGFGSYGLRYDVVPEEETTTYLMVCRYERATDEPTLPYQVEFLVRWELPDEEPRACQGGRGLLWQGSATHQARVRWSQNDAPGLEEAALATLAEAEEEAPACGANPPALAGMVCPDGLGDGVLLDRVSAQLDAAHADSRHPGLRSLSCHYDVGGFDNQITTSWWVDENVLPSGCRGESSTDDGYEAYLFSPDRRADAFTDVSGGALHPEAVALAEEFLGIAASQALSCEGGAPTHGTGTVPGAGATGRGFDPVGGLASRDTGSGGLPAAGLALTGAGAALTLAGAGGLAIRRPSRADRLQRLRNRRLHDTRALDEDLARGQAQLDRDQAEWEADRADRRVEAQAIRDAGQAEADWWTRRGTRLGRVEKVLEWTAWGADRSVDALAALTGPAGGRVKDLYTVGKRLGKGLGEMAASGGNVAKLVKGGVEGALDLGFSKRVSKHPVMDRIFRGKVPSVLPKHQNWANRSAAEFFSGLTTRPTRAHALRSAQWAAAQSYLRSAAVRDPAKNIALELPFEWRARAPWAGRDALTKSVSQHLPGG